MEQLNMNQLIFLLILGGLLFVFSLVALFRPPRKNEATDEGMDTLLKIVPLPGLDFKHSRVLFDDADYRSIAAEPKFKSIAEQLRRDRQRIALAWLRLLRADVYTLWRFRRLLTTFGVCATPKEELRSAASAMGLLALLLGLRVVVTLFGPFAFASVAVRVRDDVRGFSSYCGQMLSHLPMYQLAQFENNWRSLGAAQSARS
jgi:hypothetical protein